MTISTGTRLGPYEVLAPIGAGGMGEVYKAKDTRLNRTVAIKVLPEHLADSPERKARFEREAKAISQLNHPHICTLHDVGEQDGVRLRQGYGGQVDFIVMEYIEGETLAERLKKGALKLDQALEYGIQIADGLDKAHRAGIVHRDLKPGNVMLTKSGVKLLDFGLAKELVGEVSTSSDYPTQQRDLTHEAAVIGTPRYMSPEQLEGKAVDARTDIFAFGAVLFETLTGYKAFEGESHASLTAAILTGESPSLTSLLPGVSPLLERTISKCLEKDPDSRWQTARDLADEMRWIHSQPSRGIADAVGAGAKFEPRRFVWAVLGALAGAVVAATGALFLSSPTSSTPPTSMRFREPAPELVGLKYSPPLVISSDGSRIALATGLSLETADIRLRETDTLEWRLLSDTSGGDMPFFSPDGEWLGYFTNGELKKVRVSGGVPSTIGPVQNLRAGATWGPDDTIVFSAAGSGLMRIEATGGTPEPVTTLGPREMQHWWPQFLPDGSAVLFSVNLEGRYYAAVIDMNAERHRVLEDLGEAHAPRYVDTGHLVYVSGEQLLAVEFDAAQLQVKGAPVPMSGLDIYVAPANGLAYYDISSAGHLVYLAGTPSEGTLTLVDRNGAGSPLADARGVFYQPRFAPDGTKVALVDPAGVNRTWILDLESGTRSLLTGREQSYYPIWGPEPGSVTFTTGAYRSIHWTIVGSTDDTELVRSDYPVFPGAWSPDGSALVYAQEDPVNRSDIWMVDREGAARPLLSSKFEESYPDLSPDGKWLAYVSDESGRPDVYVVRFPDLGERFPVSSEGGGEPLWSRRGGELFYRQGAGVMSVSVQTEPGFRASRPRELFQGPYLSRATAGGVTRTYDVAPDGNHFLMLELGDTLGQMELRVVLNWSQELEKLVATSN